jgi:group I intron endonuclease
MIVYALVDPMSREARYVGETVRVFAKRLSQHITTAKAKTTPPVNAWIRGLLEKGCGPELVELESCDSREAMHEAEVYWIEQFRAMGAKLLNIAPGGSTRVGYRHSEETKARWRRERRGENAPMFGKRRTPEEKAAAAERTRQLWKEKPHPMLGRKLSPERIRQLQEARKKVPVSQASLDALARGRITRWGQKD